MATLIGSHTPMLCKATPGAVPRPAPIASPAPVDFLSKAMNLPVSVPKLSCVRSRHHLTNDYPEHNADREPCPAATENQSDCGTDANPQRDSKSDLHRWSLHSVRVSLPSRQDSSALRSPALRDWPPPVD
jgi:hypothetical protein